MYVILCECPDAMNLFAPDCGSWGLTARGTSMRSELNPAGREALSWVSCNNCMVSRSIGCSYRLLAHKFHMVVPLYRISAIRSPRCVLLILLIMCKNGAWLLEQPQGSLLSKYSRWEWLCNRVAKALQTILCVCVHICMCCTCGQLSRCLTREPRCMNFARFTSRLSGCVYMMGPVPREQ